MPFGATFTRFRMVAIATSSRQILVDRILPRFSRQARAARADTSNFTELRNKVFRDRGYHGGDEYCQRDSRFRPESGKPAFAGCSEQYRQFAVDRPAADATNAANAVNFPAAYSALRVNQTDAAGGGTSATVATITPATVYEPTAPFADDNCMVAGPNVDRANELLQLLVARYTFAANAQVIRADAQMSASLLNITA
jgi:flagellar basal-body rod protein FlgC